jgi:hypothetical protein
MEYGSVGACVVGVSVGAFVVVGASVLVGAAEGDALVGDSEVGDALSGTCVSHHRPSATSRALGVLERESELGSPKSTADPGLGTPSLRVSTPADPSIPRRCVLG